MFKSQFGSHDAKSYGLECKDLSRTKQSDKDLCDINLIMKKYAKSGDLSLLNRRVASYGEVFDDIGYVEAFNRVQAVNELFASLDARTRERFGNDPKQFLAFGANPANVSELVELGILDVVQHLTQPGEMDVGQKLTESSESPA